MALDEVDRTSEQLGQGIFCRCALDERAQASRFGVNENINIAVRSEVIAQDRSEQSQAVDVMLSTQSAQPATIGHELYGAHFFRRP